eukprot:6182156-Pleurochrysis_carterae.AAC.1
MATNSVTRRLPFNSMSPHPVGVMRPVESRLDDQVALHYTHLVISECTSISGQHCLRRPASQIFRQCHICTS